MEFLNLEKGDPNNLEGSVIVYARPNIGSQELKHFNSIKEIIRAHPEIISKLNPEIDPSMLENLDYLLDHFNEDMMKNIDPSIVAAMYATSNLVNFKEKFSHISNLEKIIDEKIKRDDSKLPPNARVENCYCSQFFTSLDELKDSKEDILDLGEPLGSINFHVASFGAIQFYMARYNQQRERKANYSKEKAKQINEEITPFTTYSDVSREERLTHIQKNYISPIMLEFERGNIEKAKQLSQNFIRYCEKSPLEDDSYAVAATLNLDKPNHAKYRPSLINNYFSKIIAITQENYKEAAKFRDEIKSLQDKIKSTK